MKYARQSAFTEWATRALLSVLLITTVTLPAAAQLQISSPDGKASVRMGLLLQGRAEWLRAPDPASDQKTTSQNLYLRRLRLILGGKVDDRVSFFLDTDGPNLAKPSTTGDKEFADLYLQDIFATWTWNEALHFDTGLILTPGAYNHLQSAASLLAMDYGPYTFLESTPLKARIGRDAGIQARGLLYRGHVEYRLGVFQGLRNASGTTPFRTVARLSWSPYQAESGLFYPGTNLGKKSSLSFGVAGDIQQEYRAMHADCFLDRPIGGGHALTFQADISRVDGRTFLTSLPAQTLFMTEVGVSMLSNRITPYVQAAREQIDHAAGDETSAQAGIAFWVDGHKAALKVAGAWAKKDEAGARDQLLMQYQAFTF